MFVEACSKMMKYTRPVVSSIMYADGRTASPLGTYFIVNRDGWAITAAHMLEAVKRYQDDAVKIREVDRRNAEEPGRNEQYDLNWVKGHSLWWGADGIGVQTAHVIGDLDIALVKLINIPANFFTEYPVFADPSDIKVGKSLCRIGFPFARVNCTFDKTTNRFCLEGAGPGMLSFFPNDGILTRFVNIPFIGPDGSQSQKNPLGITNMQIETSTPGLKGQSGGPICDARGNVVAMQSVTRHLPLDFGDKTIDGKYMPEQFINVGYGPFVTTLTAVMDHFGVKYKTSSDDDGFRIVG